MRSFAFALLLAAAVAVPCSAQTKHSSKPKQATEVPAETGLAPEVAAAEALIVKADWKGAETKLAAYLASHPEDARALFDAGYAADAQNELDQAEAYYGRAVKADPTSFEAHLELGLLLARQGKGAEARPVLEEATQLDPGELGRATKARAWRALAQIDRRVNPTEASNELLEALKLTPETLADTLLAAELAEAAGQDEAAEAAYKRVLAKDAGNAQAQAGLAHVLIARKQYAEAETQLRAALEKSPDDPGLNVELATVLVAQDKAEALPVLEKLHTAHLEDANIQRMLADVKAEAGDTAGSDQLYIQLLAKDPKNEGLVVAHAQNLIRLQKFPEAFAAFSRATELDATDPDAWSGLAFAASKTKNPSIAIKALTTRSKYLPENASTYFLWATSYDMLRDREAAIKYYHQFLEEAAGKYPDQEWQARQRLLLLEKKR